MLHVQRSLVLCVNRVQQTPVGVCCGSSARGFRSFPARDRDAYDNLEEDDLFFELDETRTSLSRRFSLVDELAVVLFESASHAIGVAVELAATIEAHSSSDDRRFSRPGVLAESCDKPGATEILLLDELPRYFAEVA